MLPVQEKTIVIPLAKQLSAEVIPKQCSLVRFQHFIIATLVLPFLAPLEEASDVGVETSEPDSFLTVALLV